MIRPLPSRVLLCPPPRATCTTGGLHLLAPACDQWYDGWEWVILACGTSVPSELQPGMRVCIHPGEQGQHNFEYCGLPFKTIPWKAVKMVLGVPDEI